MLFYTGSNGTLLQKAPDLISEMYQSMLSYSRISRLHYKSQKQMWGGGGEEKKVLVMITDKQEL
jgi:hypothetical protein